MDSLTVRLSRLEKVTVLLSTNLALGVVSAAKAERELAVIQY